MWNSENVSPQRGRAALRELRRLAARPPPGVKLLLRDDDLTDIVALLEGPAETPYSGGVFRVRLVLGREFPAAPPRAYFLTRIFHPNVGRGGEVCVSTLRRDWRPELGLEHALLALRCLLIAPNADSALNADAGALLRAHYDDYFRRAKLLTDIHARPANPHSHPQDDSSSTVTSDGDGDEAPPPSGAGGGGDGGTAPPAAGSTDTTQTTQTTQTTEATETTETTAAPPDKRSRRARSAHKPAPARDKRRVLKRL